MPTLYLIRESAHFQAEYLFGLPLRRAYSQTFLCYWSIDGNLFAHHAWLRHSFTAIDLELSGLPTKAHSLFFCATSVADFFVPKA